MTKPTYQADEIKRMCLETDMNHEEFKILSDLINEEIEFYSTDELVILCEISMIMFTKSMLKLTIKNLK